MDVRVTLPFSSFSSFMEEVSMPISSSASTTPEASKVLPLLPSVLLPP